MPGKNHEQDVDRDTFDVIIKKIIPWVNELANAAMSESHEGFEPTEDIEGLNS